MKVTRKQPIRRFIVRHTHSAFELGDDDRSTGHSCYLESGTVIEEKRLWGDGHFTVFESKASGKTYCTFIGNLDENHEPAATLIELKDNELRCLSTALHDQSHKRGAPAFLDALLCKVNEVLRKTNAESDTK